MRRKITALMLSAALIALGGCSGEDVSAEIKIPIVDGNSAMGSYTTAAAERYDLSEYSTIGAEVAYAYAEKITAIADTNILSYSVRKGDVLNKGDVIAVLDSSGLDYDYQNQRILTDNAYSRYQSSGSRLAQIEYEIEAKKLEMLEYEIDSYTIKAPYDCVVWTAEFLSAGDSISAGTPICTIADRDDVYVVVSGNNDAFALGRNVSLKFGTNSEFSGRVVMMPDSRNFRGGVQIALDEGELERANEEAGSIVAAGWASVIVKTYNEHNMLCVPEKAVMSYSGSTYCYLDSDGSRVRIPVETGRTVNGLTVILSGLTDGDVVSY